MPRFDLIHGGVWDGWWIAYRDDGQRRLMRPLANCEMTAILATSRLEDVTPKGALPNAPAIDLEIRAAHLTVIEGGA